MSGWPALKECRWCGAFSRQSHRGREDLKPCQVRPGGVTGQVCVSALPGPSPVRPWYLVT